MSEANKALCRRFVEEVWNNRNLSVIEEIFAPNFTQHDPNAPDFGRGPESVRKLVNHYLIAFPDTRFTIDDMIAEGDKVVMRWTARATHRGEFRGIPPTGKQLTISGTTTQRIENGRMVESYVNWDALGLMQQMGVVQQKSAGRATA